MARLVSRRAVLAALVVVSLAGSASAQTDPLPSWNEGATKKAITDFVARVTTQGSPDFVPVDLRIATFDNDGTLWCEQPVYFQVAFAFDRLKAMAAQHPEWKAKQPFKAVLDGDMKALAASGQKGLLEIVAVTTPACRSMISKSLCWNGQQLRAIRASSGLISNSSTSRCWS